MLFAIVCANNPPFMSAYLGVSTNDLSSLHDLVATFMNKNYIGNGRWSVVSYSGNCHTIMWTAWFCMNCTDCKTNCTNCMDCMVLLPPRSIRVHRVACQLHIHLATQWKARFTGTASASSRTSSQICSDSKNWGSGSYFARRVSSSLTCFWSFSVSFCENTTNASLQVSPKRAIFVKFW